MTLAALRREILVAATPHRTFELFTGHIGSWWPLATYSVFGDGTVAFEGSELVERSGDNRRCGPRSPAGTRRQASGWTGIRGRIRRRPPTSW